MIFEQIRIHNLFSYYGEQIFDLTLPNDGRNVVLIGGRNGFGKTSFINSLKLLFLGPHESLRSALQVGRKPSVANYLLGMGDEWLGIFNRQARREGQTEFGVSVDWREPEGKVTAQRHWRLDGRGGCEEILRVTLDFADPLEDDEADDFLERRLPKDFISFFFYDGEQVQRLAEANREGQLAQVEKILDIADIDILDEYIGKTITAWRREKSESSPVTQLVALQGNMNLMQEQQKELSQKIDELSEELTSLEQNISRNRRYLEHHRAFVHQRDEAVYKNDEQRILDQLEAISSDLASRLPIDAPLLFNPELVSKTAADLRRLTDSQAGGLAQEVQILLNALPVRLLDEPPHCQLPLSEQQREFYRKKLLRILRSYESDPEDISDGLMRLDPTVAAQLIKRLNYYQLADNERQRAIDDLRQISQLKRDLEGIQRKLDDMSSLSDEEQRIYQERQKQNAEFEQQRDILRDQLRDLKKGQLEKNRAIEKIQQEIKQQESAIRLDLDRQKRVDLATTLQRLFRSYKQELKLRRRKDIEEAINRRFSELMTSHHQIAHIKVGESFDLHYLNAIDESLGMAGMASGMKQLIATALLWALKDVSGRSVPVVIDTPLARIDREHQINLLTRYYPNAGDQVIILPTDSELDHEKYQILKPHVYCEYRLANASGENTNPLREPLFVKAV
ncbi:MAG: DNA sulfur modification protein DndD [Candidatus Contendobacter sp.]|nr:DNA sulfur modification protein DndD [Candidatus Contendobacter sp.]